MTDSTFDPSTFMQQNIDAPMATAFQVVPAGEYQAMIDDFDEKAFEHKTFTYQKGPNAGQPGSMVVFSIPFLIQDEALKASMERKDVRVSARPILQFDDNGALSTGKDKNVLLGQIREAVGQNSGSWNPTMLKGAGPLLVKVTHRPNEKNPEQPYAEVTRVAPIR